jgi:predicted acylesterase/phospholipase RssA
MKRNFLLHDLQYIVFSGGAQRGNAFIGAMSVLQDFHALCQPKISFYNQIKGYAGVSIGSLFALGCSLGIPIKKFQKWCLKQETMHFIEKVDVMNVYYSKGILSKDLISKYVQNLLVQNQNILQKILQLRNQSPQINQNEINNESFLNSITFYELYQITNKWLRVIGSNLSKQQVLIMDYINTPSLSIVTALTASMSIPFVFEPSSISNKFCLAANIISTIKQNYHNQQNNNNNNSKQDFNKINQCYRINKNNMNQQNNDCCCIVDGGIYDNYPITIFPIEKTLGFRLRSTKSKQTILNNLEFGIQEYCVNLLMNTMEYYEDYILQCLPDIYMNHTITIYLPTCSAIEMICASKDLKKIFIMYGEYTMFFYLFFDKVLYFVFFFIILLLTIKDHQEKEIEKINKKKEENK